MIRNLIRSFASFPFKQRQERLAESRRALDELEFVIKIAESGGDTDAAKLVWEKLSEWTQARNFSPYPDDSLEYVFGIAEEELDEEMILDILDRLNIPTPNREIIAKFGKVDTPCRIAQLVAVSRNAYVARESANTAGRT